MPSHRSLRMAEAIREVVATAILFEVADPRVRSVTVLRVEVSGDLRQPRCSSRSWGPRPSGSERWRASMHATGFLQARVAARLQTRFTPVSELQVRRQRQEIGRDRPPDRRGRRLRSPRRRLSPIETVTAADPDEEEDAVEPAGTRQPVERSRSADPSQTGKPSPARLPVGTRLTDPEPQAQPSNRIDRLMATQSKTQFLTDVHTLLKRRYKPKADRNASRLSVLKAVVYGICHEDTTREQANQALSRFKDEFFDWNEVRVSSVDEIQETLAGIPDPETRAQRIRRFLRQLFNRTYGFTLDALTKKPLKEALKVLQTYEAFASDYVTATVIQQALGRPRDPGRQAAHRARSSGWGSPNRRFRRFVRCSSGPCPRTAAPSSST